MVPTKGTVPEDHDILERHFIIIVVIIIIILSNFSDKHWSSRDVYSQTVQIHFVMLRTLSVIRGYLYYLYWALINRDSVS